MTATRILTGAAIAMVLSIGAAANAGGLQDTYPAFVQSEAGTNQECEAEAAAFTDVADLAYAFSDDEDVFSGALFELREQLLDCLLLSSDADRESALPWSIEPGSLPEMGRKISI